MNKYSALMLIFFLTLFMSAGCSMLELESTWKDRDIALDGKEGDWLGAKYFFEEFSISVGLINDEQHLYVSMITENPMIRAQIMRRGLTVWLDPKGGKNKIFGIRFPLGRQEARQEEEMTLGAMIDEAGREELMKKIQESMTELEVLGRDENVLAKLDVEDARGIEVRMRDAGGTFVYELRVPLASSEAQPFAVGAKDGDVIGVGFLSPKLQMPRAGGRRGGGMPPGVGMPPGGGVMGGGGMRPMMPRELKIWAKVRLASGSNPVVSLF